jgi:hypothetical protein
MTRRLARNAFLAFAVALAGCNALLGNEGGSLEPDPEGGDPDVNVAFDGETDSRDASRGVDAGWTFDSSSDAALTAEADAAWESGADSPSDSRPSDARDAGARDADVRDESAARDAGIDVSPDTPRCVDHDGCSAGFNCERGTCVAPTVSCAAQKSTYPASTDGVYWINPAGTAMRAYCDMKIVTELCTEIEGEHHGRTREGSNLGYTMRSILHARDGQCGIWAVRAADGYPIRVLTMVAGQTLTTCQALGFVSDGVLNACAFGDSAGNSNCGYPFGTPYYQYGNLCAGCVIGDGESPTYVKQGPMHSSSVISTFDGSTQSFCKVR